MNMHDIYRSALQMRYEVNTQRALIKICEKYFQGDKKI